MSDKIKIVEKICEIRKVLREAQAAGKVVGFVPTMGALHAGHASLIATANEQCDMVVVSIFVNPTQFAPNEDLDKYPRTPEKDLQTCQANGADYIFMPSVEEMYPHGKDSVKTSVAVESLAGNLCGQNRPTHFAGVCGVVAKLFNIVPADKAYFGEKDFQQARIIEQMVEDLNFPVEVVKCPIVREDNGLAMSSRNAYLTEQQRAEAVALSESLRLARAVLASSGPVPSADIIKLISENIAQKAPSGQIDYVQIVDIATLKDAQVAGGNILIALAVKFGQTRLIDNICLEVAY